MNGLQDIEIQRKIERDGGIELIYFSFGIWILRA